MAPWLRMLALAAALLGSGCVTDEGIICALNAVNHDFRLEYERILLEKGTRVYRVKRDTAYAALQGAFERIGMPVDAQSPDIGYLSVRGPAPKPLDMQEWKTVVGRDLPRMHELAVPCVGIVARLRGFEPDGLDVIITATTLEVRDGTEVQLTARMREVVPPKSGRPRREYLPPTAVSMGLDKIWREVDRDLRDATWRR